MSSDASSSSQSVSRNLLLASLSGILAGIAAAILLHSLNAVAKTQIRHPDLLYALPIAGLLIGGLYDRFGKRATQGTHLILAEIHLPSERVPARMTPLILFTSLISHLFGASVGREGIAVQMGASLSDQLSRVFRLTPEDRRVLLRAGSAAGFGGALGAPLAGMIFGLEVLRGRARYPWLAWAECALASLISVAVTHALRVSHTVYGTLPESLGAFAPGLLFAALVFGATTGLLVRIFIALTELLSDLGKRLFASAAARAFFGGLCVIAAVAVFSNRDSTGLGIPSIQSAFLSASPTTLPFQKLALTALSIGFGFKGGEFVPLVFIGATVCSSIAFFLSAPTSFAAACGISSSFGSAARVPLALSVFGAEHFGTRFFLYALAANLAARMVAGKNGLFPVRQ